MAESTQTDSGLVKRGFFLLLLIGGLVTVVLWIIFQKPAQTLPPEAKKPEPLLAGLMATDVAFPASVHWGALVLVSERLPSSPGWKVRYNAAASLARLGSKETPWPLLAEMLDEEQQMRNFRIQLETGQVVADEAAARLTMITTLKAIKDWHAKQTQSVTPTPAMSRVYARIDELSGSAVVELKKQAEETREAIRAAAKRDKA